MSEASFDVSVYIRMVWQRKFLFAAVSMMVITAGTLYSYMLPKEYMAQSTVFIEENVINRLVSGIAVTPSMSAKIRVLKVAILSRSMLNKVMSDLDMDLKVKTEVDRENMVRKLQKNTSISLDERRGYFRISYIDKNPALARDFINALVRNYIQENTSVKREESVEATRFLAEQIDFYKRRIDDIEEEINAYKQKMGMKLAVSEAQLLKEIGDTEAALEKVSTRRKMLKAQVEMLRNAPATPIPTEAAPVDYSGDAEKIAALEEQLQMLRVKYTDQHPKVKQVQAMIDELQGTDEAKSDETGPSEAKAGEAEPEEAEAAEKTAPAPEPEKTEVAAKAAPAQSVENNPQYYILKVELDAMNDEEGRLRADLREKKDLLNELPVISREMRELASKRDNEKLIYDQLVSRYGKSEVSKRMELQDKSIYFRVVDPAILPNQPVSPNRVMIMGMSLVAGLGAAFGLVFLLNFMDRSVRSISELRTLNFPVLAVIPEIQNQARARLQQRRNVAFYGIVGIFLLGFGGVLAMEFFGLTYVEDALAALDAPEKFEKLRQYLLS